MKHSFVHREDDRPRFAHVHLKPDEQIAMHQQPSWELSYIVTGQGTRIVGDTREAFYPGEVVLVVPEMEHVWNFNPQFTDHKGLIENYTMQFSTRFIEKLSFLFSDFQAISDKLMEIKKRESVKFPKETAKRLIPLFRQMDTQSEAEQVATLLHMLVIISECDENQVIGRFVVPTQMEDRLKEIDIYISCNYKREINIDQIATHVGMNRTSFCSFFKKQKGVTFVTYLNQFRIGVACYLLGNPALTISDVCYQSGYNDLPYFTRLFKRMQGVSPSEYRRSKVAVSQPGS